MFKSTTFKIILALTLVLPLAACGNRVDLKKPENTIEDSTSF